MHERTLERASTGLVEADEKGYQLPELIEDLCLKQESVMRIVCLRTGNLSTCAASACEQTSDACQESRP